MPGRAQESPEDRFVKAITDHLEQYPEKKRKELQDKATDALRRNVGARTDATPPEQHSSDQIPLQAQEPEDKA